MVLMAPFSGTWGFCHYGKVVKAWLKKELKLQDEIRSALKDSILQVLLFQRIIRK